LTCRSANSQLTLILSQSFNVFISIQLCPLLDVIQSHRPCLFTSGVVCQTSQLKSTSETACSALQAGNLLNAWQSGGRRLPARRLAIERATDSRVKFSLPWQHSLPSKIHCLATNTEKISEVHMATGAFYTSESSSAFCTKHWQMLSFVHVLKIPGCDCISLVSTLRHRPRHEICELTGSISFNPVIGDRDFCETAPSISALEL